MNENFKASGPRAVDIAYLRFEAPDLGLMEDFLKDFGMHVTAAQTASGSPALYSRGTDGAPFLHEVVEAEHPRFVGMGFVMHSAEELKELAAMEGASNIEEAETPGGGSRVRFTDPQGFEVDAVFGWNEVEKSAPRQRVPVNSGENRRRTGVPVRLEPGPSHVKRLGHIVLFVENFTTSEAWYKQRFGLRTTDEIFAGDESNIIGAFLRCDRGDIPTDHHTVFLIGNTEKAGELQHAAFEVNDWDDVLLGHDYLKARNYKPNWGIGKHILGSQVFDYWLDPYGHVVEHFSDGDLFDASKPKELHSVDTLRGVQWGPTFPHA
ncbi:MAG: VOC family protein [Pseudomonadota bacterium]